MTITSVGINPFLGVSSTNAANPAPDTEAAVNGAPSPGAISMTLSPRSQFLTKLQSLLGSDPGGASNLVSGLATQMRARGAQGGAHAGMANALAARLESAVTSGNYSSLFDGGGSGNSASGGSASAASTYAAMTSTHSSY